MSDKVSNRALSDILDDLVASEPVINSQTMTRWIGRYPEYERELMDFAARWSLITHLPADESPLDDEQGFYSRGLEAVHNMIRASRKKTVEVDETISSLLAEGQHQGLNISKIAALSDLSVPIIAKFEQRLISFSSIPREAIMNVAQALKLSYESVATYLQGAPGFAAGASYKSDTAPELPSQQDFSAAVKDDRTLSEDKKSRWLKVASRPYGQQ